MSFRLKTILGIALIEIVVLAILVISSLHDLRASNTRELFSRATTTAQLFAAMTSDAIIATDLATLDSLIQQTLKNEGLIYVRILNKNGVVLSQGGDEAALADVFVSDRGVSSVSDQRIDLAEAIQIGGGYFGEVQIGLSTHLLDDVVTKGTQRMLMLAGFEILLVGIFGYFLGSFLTRQLADLRAASKRVAAGELGHVMNVTGRDELADTARSFNKMSVSLQKYSREVEDARAIAENKRVYAETLLHNAMNSVSQAIFITDAQDQVEFINRAAFDLYQMDKDAFGIGTPFIDVIKHMATRVETEDAQSIHSLIRERIARFTKSDKQQAWHSRQKDGKVILHSQLPVSNKCTVMIDTDVTELFGALEKSQKLELELLQTQKLEALGTLASGVAHEINTPTQFINDNAHFLKDAFDDIAQFLNENAGDKKIDTNHSKAFDWGYLREEIPTALGDMISGLDSISQIVRSIRDYSHPNTQDLQTSDIRRLVRNAVTISQSQWRDAADVSIIGVPHGVDIACYPGDLTQVIINLIVNAADAIAETGNSSEKGQITVNFYQDQETHALEIIDNGPGIDNDHIHRIFDMFFTTKAPGKGTGQGLAICKSIIETKHKGRLLVTSGLSGGTTFTIKLPIEPIIIDEHHTDKVA